MSGWLMMSGSLLLSGSHRADHDGGVSRSVGDAPGSGGCVGLVAPQ